MPDCIPGVVRDSFGDVIFSNLPLLYCEYKGGDFFCIGSNLDGHRFYLIFAKICLSTPW